MNPSDDSNHQHVISNTAIIDTQSNRSVNQQYDSKLFMYHFLIPLLLVYLQDVDVLTRMLPTAKAMKKPLMGYVIKRDVDNKLYVKLVNEDRYLPVLFSRLKVRIDTIVASPISSMVSLQHLTLDFLGAISSPLCAGMLPRSLVKLALLSGFNQPLNRDMLPDQLHRLLLGERFNQYISPGTLPDTLHHLSLNTAFNQPLEIGSLPDSLRSLNFAYCSTFNQPLCPGSLPVSLRKLDLRESFQHRIEDRSIAAQSDKAIY